MAEHISSFEDDINPVAIETYISRLRKKLDLTSKLKTVRGLGYLLDDSE
ncbi:MAG: helix-turn-helix domain-containing protein [Arenicella sp.]